MILVIGLQMFVLNTSFGGEASCVTTVAIQ